MIRFVLFVFFISFYCFGQQIDTIKKYKNDSLYIGVKNTSVIPIWYKELKRDSIDYSTHQYDVTVMQPKDSLFPIAIIPLHVLKDTSTVVLKDFVNYSFTRANPRAVHDNTFLYELPYAKGTKYEVIQTFNNSFSHNLPGSRYAVDFKMPIGSLIHAARSGIVVNKVEKFKEHGGPDFREKGNEILILHDDGTLAQYSHLDYNGADVEIGDVIQQGQYIGKSGHTGYSTRPHLHLVIKNGDGISLPFYFKIRPKKKLKNGKTYLRR
ncbi:M23 family metallopeptidase [uncultured Dokdonia sp.]|uniref:M23 family metallopeptidase n=1 Tax=uncultured Dokdonia sp. TaxID=575653 RepID=UPI0026225088|nr:M23 family metallopeptidase [uncultured Dokdonia sp.]